MRRKEMFLKEREAAHKQVCYIIFIMISSADLDIEIAYDEVLLPF